MLKGELIFSILIFVAALILYWVTGSFGARVVLGGGSASMGPAFWPQLILGTMMLLALVVAVGTARKIAREKAWGESITTMDRGKIRFFAALALIVAYLFLLPLAGFIFMTPFFLMAFMLLLGEKSKGWILGVSVGMTAVIVILFTKAMYVPLPRGEWLFREFSLLFY
jgi:cation transport ATPase